MVYKLSFRNMAELLMDSSPKDLVYFTFLHMPRNLRVDSKTVFL